jgi:hypothetical protein
MDPAFHASRLPRKKNPNQRNNQTFSGRLDDLLVVQKREMNLCVAMVNIRQKNGFHGGRMGFCSVSYEGREMASIRKR